MKSTTLLLLFTFVLHCSVLSIGAAVLTTMVLLKTGGNVVLFVAGTNDPEQNPEWNCSKNLLVGGKGVQLGSG